MHAVERVPFDDTTVVNTECSPGGISISLYRNDFSQRANITVAHVLSGLSPE